MTKKIDKAEFIARLDGTLEEKIYQAFYHGCERGYNMAKPPGNPTFAANWQINVVYNDWKKWIEEGCPQVDNLGRPKDEEVEK